MKAVVLFVLLASQTALASEACFSSNSARSWRYDQQTRTLQVRAAGGTYAVETFFCHELPWARKIAFKSFFGSRVCRGDEIIVMNAWDEVVDTCRIDSIKRLSN